MPAQAKKEHLIGIRLSPVQRSVVQHGDGALLVVAGPGSGKTRVLTERMRRLLSESTEYFRILALTFTNKAANEMKERLAEVPAIEERAFVGTLHSFCMEVLSNRGTHLGIEKLPHIFESFQDRKQILRQAVLSDPELIHVLRSKGDAREQDRTVGKWLELIATAKNNLLLPETLEDALLARVYDVYNKGLHACNALDFDDLLLLTYRLYLERPSIADFYRRQYRYLCVDEAQDLNEAQYQVIRALCGPHYRNVMMVGDPRQAIFVWNGANPKYLDLFEHDFGAKKIAMTENFRSSRSVVRAAQALDPEYEVEGQLPIRGSVKLIVGEDEADEAKKVLNYLDDLIENGHADIEGDLTLDRCALLGRTRYVLTSVENELKQRGWTYYKQLSSQHESESALLRNFELCLRVLANPQDRLHLGVLLKNLDLNHVDMDSLNSTSGLDLLRKIARRVSSSDSKAVFKAIDKMEWSEDDFVFPYALDHLEAYAQKLTKQEDRALILEDIKIWRQHWDVFLRAEVGGRHPLPSFLSQVALGATQQPRQDGLTLLTVHSAKGLEFDVVVVMGMAEGTFPDYRARGAALEEEKRNAFVAITRSKRLLALSYPVSKMMPWGDTWAQKPSRYLAAIGLLKSTS